jgi:hypothetical protein
MACTYELPYMIKQPPLDLLDGRLVKPFVPNTSASVRSLADNQLVLSLSESGQARLVYGSISIELITNEHTVGTNERMFICNGRIMHWDVNRLATVFIASCDTLFVVQVKVDQRTYTVASIPMVVNAMTTQGFVVTSSGDAYKVNKPSLSKPIRQDNVSSIMKLVRTGCWVA